MIPVANKTRPEENDAADVIAAHLGVARPISTDFNGEADLQFITVDGTAAAVEVTILTDEHAHGNDAARRRADVKPYRPTGLTKCWNVLFADDRVVHRGLRRRLEPHLAVLEAAGVDQVWHYEIYSSDLAERTRAAVAALVREGAELASVVPVPPGRSMEPAIHITTSTAYSSSGTAAALENIEAYVAARTDNLRKLAAADVSERHLFIWLDAKTPGEVAAPFVSTRATEWDHFGLPTRPPELPAIITTLWVAHRGTRRGWVHSPGAGWSWLTEGAVA